MTPVHTTNILFGICLLPWMLSRTATKILPIYYRVIHVDWSRSFNLVDFYCSNGPSLPLLLTSTQMDLQNFSMSLKPSLICIFFSSSSPSQSTTFYTLTQNSRPVSLTQSYFWRWPKCKLPLLDTSRTFLWQPVLYNHLQRQKPSSNNCQ